MLLSSLELKWNTSKADIWAVEGAAQETDILNLAQSLKH